MGGFCLLVELHREGSAPAGCTTGLLKYLRLFMESVNSEFVEFQNTNVCTRPGTVFHPLVDSSEEAISL